MALVPEAGSSRAPCTYVGVTLDSAEQESHRE